MKKLINEYEQTKKILNKLRLLKEDIWAEDNGFKDSSNDNGVTKNGEKITFDELNTVGFFKTNITIDKNNKFELISAIGQFIKDTGLIINSVQITLEEGRLILLTDSIKNPGMGIIKSIIIDTENDQPTINIIGGTMSLDDDFISLIQNIKTAYDDPQIGRNHLVQLSQIK